jgi:hypothetical protein
MFQSLLLLQAPETTSQATHHSPPAVAQPAKPLVVRRKQLKFGLSVLGNSVGFGAILVTCWFSLQLMRVFIPV